MSKTQHWEKHRRLCTLETCLLGCWPPCCSPPAGCPTAVPLWVPALRDGLLGGGRGMVSGRSDEWWTPACHTSRMSPVRDSGMKTRVYSTDTETENAASQFFYDIFFCRCGSPAHQIIWSNRPVHLKHRVTITSRSSQHLSSLEAQISVWAAII